MMMVQPTDKPSQTQRTRERSAVRSWSCLQRLPTELASDYRLWETLGSVLRRIRNSRRRTRRDIAAARPTRNLPTVRGVPTLEISHQSEVPVNALRGETGIEYRVVVDLRVGTTTTFRPVRIGLNLVEQGRVLTVPAAQNVRKDEGMWRSDALRRNRRVQRQLSLQYLYSTSNVMLLGSVSTLLTDVHAAH
jgi:hypothetical protein